LNNQNQNTLEEEPGCFTMLFIGVAIAIIVWGVWKVSDRWNEAARKTDVMEKIMIEKGWIEGK
jgi:hypothetical protein